jgi:transposase
VRLVRRISVLLDYVVSGRSVKELTQQWGVSASCLYQWLVAFLLQGMASLVYHHGGGRPPRLTKTQKQRVCEVLDAGPQAAGFATACWGSLLIQQVIWRTFGVLYNRFSRCQLLRNMGYSFQTAQFLSDHLDHERRQAWLQQKWPQILRDAKQRGALILFEDEASFAHWGSLSDTWAWQGHTPLVKTSGKRKAYKVFGCIEFFSGRVFYQGIEGRLNALSYQTFLLTVLAQTKKPLFLIHDGARYHTSKAMREFFEQQRDRLTVDQLPSYSPDDNPIEYLWRKTKKESTHNQYCEQFASLVSSVEDALARLATQPQEVLGLFGRYCHEVGLARDLAA